MVFECPDCEDDFPTGDVGDDCPECGSNLTQGVIIMLDYVIQCAQCSVRVAIQTIVRGDDGEEDICPECGESPVW